MSVDTTVKKVSGQASPHGEMDQAYLVSGKRVSLRLWRNEEPQSKAATKREYETVGYVLSGRAELTIEGQTIKLDAGEFLAGSGRCRARLPNPRGLHCPGSDLASRAGAWTRCSIGSHRALRCASHHRSRRAR